VTDTCCSPDFLIDPRPEGFSLCFAMAGGHNISTDSELRDARTEVLLVLRSLDPTFLLPEPPLGQKHRVIADAFIQWLSTTGFALEIVALDDVAPGMFEGRWTHNGAAFVGFKQPPAAPNPEDATILACAALLRNEWCRARLPKLR
jgi:hypothetical protein